mmetsp:Transcript_4294/g.12264  ORF Transcript_4294/g.12264 Transcript_4294/m.12264 type:complete len:516 (+) Transcript_4294:115-1662(+)
MPPRENFGGGETRNRRGAAARTMSNMENGVDHHAPAASATAHNADDSSLDVPSPALSSLANDKPGSRNSRMVMISLPILVFTDMFAVSLVVPLLFQYYKMAGVSSANQRELLSSVFSTSQIVGGLIFGAMTDAKLLRRKTILYLSFGGSAVSYFLIAYGNFGMLLFSRVLVGLVKQTMTVSTSIITRLTAEEDRAIHIGRLQSAATGAWIAGPTFGAFLFTWDSKAPALVACVLFTIITFASVVILPEDLEDSKAPGRQQQQQQQRHNETTSKPSSTQNKNKTFWENLRYCFSSKKLGYVIASLLLFSWINRSTSYSSMGSYYEDMYGLQPHHRGYIQSYQSILKFVVQSALIGPVLQYAGGERMASCMATFALSVATWAETNQSLPMFLGLLCPVVSLSLTMLTVSLKSLLTNVAPEDSIFSVFAALDVLENAAAVSVPFYRTRLFTLLPRRHGTDADAGMSGDPDPVAWAFSGSIHWMVAAIAMSFMLLPDGKDDRQEKTKPRNQRYSQNKTV